MAALRPNLIAAALILFALPALAEQAPPSPSNDMQTSDAKIESCMTEARQQANDVTAHDKRIVLANQCICHRAPNLCANGMVQDYRLRQRVLENK